MFNQLNQGIRPPTHLRHLGPKTEVLRIDSSGVQMVGKMTQYDTVAEKLCQIKHFSIITGDKMICRQDLTFN